jgi:hypothetical protein
MPNQVFCSDRYYLYLVLGVGILKSQQGVELQLHFFYETLALADESVAYPEIFSGGFNKFS